MDSGTWLPIGTFLLGFAGSSITEVVRERRADRRLTAEVERVRKERLLTEERDRLLALQSALATLYRVSMIQARKLIDNAPWDPYEMQAAYVAVDGPVVRIPQDDIRELAVDCADKCFSTTLESHQDENGMPPNPTHKFNAANEAIGARLRELDAAL